jgi:MFS family permease
MPSMLIAGPILGLLAGLLVGGRLDNLLSIRFRFLQATFLGFFLRIGLEYAINHGNAPIDALRVPLYAMAFGLLLAGLWANRDQPGLNLAFVGILLNAVPILVNGGHMPVWEPAFRAAGLTPGGTEFGALHVMLSGTASSDFLLKAGPLGDIVPIPLPFYQNVASIGDIFLMVGLAFFLFASTLRTSMELDEISAAAIERRLTSITPFRNDAGRAPTVAFSARGIGSTTNLGGPALPAIPIPAFPPILERVRRHPYIRLALDGSFSALWTGQLISLIGDRVHQVALAFVVLYATGSEIALGAVFFVSLVPNLLFGAVAGTLVDRWDHREVMIVSDLLRAALVLLLPVAAVTNLVLVYPMVFLITTIGVFFRPAKGAILPRLVVEEDLTSANSAMWIAETFADIGGYAVAGLFVALLGPQLGRFLAEMREGWRFLRSESAVFANTLQATVAQFMLGIFIALMPAYAAHSVTNAPVAGSAVYGFLEGGIGVGNLIGGFAIGLLGSRIALGRMVIAGYVFTGACVAALALTGNFGAALALTFGAGVGNLAFVIPSQTIVQTRTPPELMGRLLGLRFTMVFGSMAIATAVGGILGQTIGVPVTLGVFGLITMAAGLVGLLVPAVRDV